MKCLEVCLQNPNSLFESWLENWLEEAIARDSRSQSKIRIALNSLKLYPLPLNSGKECAILRGFGSTLCERIDEKLKRHSEKVKELLNRNKIHKREINQLAKAVKLTKKKNVACSKTIHKCDEKESIDNGIITLMPGTFTIVLLIDTQETNGKYKKYLDETRNHLNMMRVKYDVRRLSIGDFLWIARDFNTNKELVLPYIVERKRMDDLASSIRDGRFSEQKHRLKCSGVPNIIYLIESVSNDMHLGIPIDHLKQAITNTRIHDHFRVVQTENNLKTANYLHKFTLFLIKQFKDKTLENLPNNTNNFHLNSANSSELTKITKLIEYNTFSITSAQNYRLNVQEIFIQQLLQLQYLSLEKALAIIRIYSTPTHLLEAYKQCSTPAEGRKMLANVHYGPLKRKIGDKISEIIYDFYNTNF